jgi:hypothetical protein
MESGWANGASHSNRHTKGHSQERASQYSPPPSASSKRALQVHQESLTQQAGRQVAYNNPSNNNSVQPQHSPPAHSTPLNSSPLNSLPLASPEPVVDLMARLKQYLCDRLVSLQNANLDIPALFFSQPLEALLAKIETSNLLELYILEARVEEVLAKTLVTSQLEQYEKQQAELAEKSARLADVADQYAEIVPNYCHVVGLALNTEPNANPNPNPSASLPQSTTLPLAASEPYDPFVEDSDMELCSPVRAASRVEGGKRKKQMREVVQRLVAKSETTFIRMH